MISYANTDEMKEIATDMRNLTNQLRETFDALYKRLTAVPTETQEWFGGKSEYYFDIISSDIIEQRTICDKLNQLSDELDDEATTLQQIAEEARQE